MPRWTTNDAENRHLSEILDQISNSGANPATIILKDGRQIVGRVLPGRMGNNRGQGMPERGYATATVRTADGEFELDYLDIARIVAGRIN